MIRNLTEDEKENIRICLTMRRNFIETSTIFYSSSDIQRMSEETRKRLDLQVLPLSLDQRKILDEIDNLLEVFKYENRT